LDTLLESVVYRLANDWPILRDEGSIESSGAACMGGLPAKTLRRVFEFVEANIDQSISLEQLASVATVSRFHFHRQFKKATGRTPHHYIVQRRIERAKALLSESALPLIEIAARLGFTDQSHFINTFRKMTAVTPRAYRNGASV
jgi:AraC family transcriptional regulator